MYHLMLLDYFTLWKKSHETNPRRQLPAISHPLRPHRHWVRKVSPGGNLWVCHKCPPHLHSLCFRKEGQPGLQRWCFHAHFPSTYTHVREHRACMAVGVAHPLTLRFMTHVVIKAKPFMSSHVLLLLSLFTQSSLTLYHSVHS